MVLVSHLQTIHFTYYKMFHLTHDEKYRKVLAKIEYILSHEPAVLNKFSAFNHQPLSILCRKIGLMEEDIDEELDNYHLLVQSHNNKPGLFIYSSELKDDPGVSKKATYCIPTDVLQTPPNQIINRTENNNLIIGKKLVRLLANTANGKSDMEF